MSLKDNISAALAEKHKNDEERRNANLASANEAAAERAALNKTGIQYLLRDDIIEVLIKLHIDKGRGGLVAYYLVRKGEALLSTPEGKGSWGLRMKVLGPKIEAPELANLTASDAQIAFETEGGRRSELSRQGVDVVLANDDSHSPLLKIDFSKVR